LKFVREVNVNSSRLKKGKKITHVNASPDGRYLLVSSNDSTVRLYENSSFELLCTYTGATNKEFQISASWSATGEYVLSGSEDANIYVWETVKDPMVRKDKAKPSLSFVAHSNMTTVIRAVPRYVGITGEVIVTAGLDGLLQVFHCRPDG